MRNCDIVMKGGITSGVVYPLAVVDLSEEFRFKNVGGTSAGAIAAAVTAAAEFRRISTGSRDGFEQIKALPEFLGGTTNGQSNLLNLFPPTKSTRRLFAVLTAFLGDGSGKFLRAFAALLVLSPLVTLLSFVPLVVVLALFWRASLLCLVIVAIAFVILGVLLLVAISAWRALVHTIPGNNFGFSTGRTPDDRDLPGVTDWLHETIQRIAGRTKDDPPLTFADLWLAGVPVTDRDKQLAAAAEERDLRSINLQMMTTALTHGHPYRLPFEKNLFSFREAELRAYFPKSVVDYLRDHPRKSKDETPRGDLRPLPEQWDLPVVVAVRMSLSFPLLFSMVPLYAVDHTRKTPEYERCWFIDGGLSSNFPLSMFDAPFPRWPTFGINLGDFHPDFPKSSDEKDNVWMVTTKGGGTSDHWTRVDTIAGYAGAMLDAIRNWHDNTLLAVPGFRDRVVLVKLAKDEGGLNLAMPPERVKALSMRGHYAGRMLRDRFGANGARFGALGWNGHRWTRYKTSMALLQKAMRRMHNAFPAKDPIYPDYNALVARERDENPETGRWWEHRPPAEYRALTEDFLDMAKKAMDGVDFDKEAPRPKPELRITPKL